MPRFSLRAALAAAACGIALAPAPAEAACSVSTTAVAFGNYNAPGGAVVDGAGGMTITCFITDPQPNVALSAGGSGSYFPREMTSGPWTLDYNLYTSAARNIIWGDGTGGTQTVNPPGTTFFFIFRRYTPTIYGRIPALQNVGAGAYADTVVVTVTW